MAGFPLVLLFSGQGSFYLKMGADLYRQYPPFRERLRESEKVWIKLGGTPLLHSFYEGEQDEKVLMQLSYSHPLLFMVQYSLAGTLIDKEVIPQPDYLLGTSLGEYVAAALSGASPLEDILMLIKLQVEELPRLCKPGGMTAVLAPPALYDNSPFLQQRATVAGINYGNHFVLSGEAGKIDQVDAWLAERDIIFQRLQVGYGFHSAFIEPVKTLFSDMEQSIRWRLPSCPVVSCGKGEVLNSFSGFSFWDIVRGPIRFKETIAMMETEGSYCYLDMGPSGTLSLFVKQNLSFNSGSTVSAFMTPYGDNMRKLSELSEYFH